ncbi:hypothetical protein [Aureimonas sp. SA4125]|nr:hypothetical protein [Aureimonas sp. SA4125]
MRIVEVRWSGRNAELRISAASGVIASITAGRQRSGGRRLSLRPL